MYHEVTPHPQPAYRKYSVTPRAFAAQMAWLAAARYQPIGLDQLLAYQLGRTGLPGRAVVITFDDGYAECAEHATPILRRRGFTATFFLVAGLMGDTSRWLADRHLHLPLMSWATARTLVASGFECGSHSISHPHLPDLPTPECREELEGSRRVLEENLGRAVPHLCYPWGAVDGRVQGLAREAGYRTACTVNIGVAARADNAFALPRVPVLGQDSTLDFISRLITARSARETLSAGLVRARAPAQKSAAA